MLRVLKQLFAVLLVTAYASQASAMFIQPDWFDPTEPGVGTNRYAYSFNDPVNLSDPGGNNPLLLPLLFGIVGATLSGAKPANAPGPNDPIATMSDGEMLARQAGGAGAAMLANMGTRTLIASCAANASCARTMMAAELAGTTADFVGCAGGDAASCIAAAVPVATTGGLRQLDSVVDLHADALANKLGGVPRVEIDGREFDVVSDVFVGQAKPSGVTMGSAFRNQAKATFEVAQARGVSVYYHFQGGSPSQGIIDKLREYSMRYDVELVIDTDPLDF